MLIALKEQMLLIKFPLATGECALLFGDLPAAITQPTSLGLEGSIGLPHQETSRRRERSCSSISLVLPLGLLLHKCLPLDLKLPGLFT